MEMISAVSVPILQREDPSQRLPPPGAHGAQASDILSTLPVGRFAAGRFLARSVRERQEIIPAVKIAGQLFFKTALGRPMIEGPLSERRGLASCAASLMVVARPLGRIRDDLDKGSSNHSFTLAFHWSHIFDTKDARFSFVSYTFSIDLFAKTPWPR